MFLGLYINRIESDDKANYTRSRKTRRSQRQVILKHVLGGWPEPFPVRDQVHPNLNRCSLPSSHFSFTPSLYYFIYYLPSTRGRLVKSCISLTVKQLAELLLVIGGPCRATILSIFTKQLYQKFTNLTKPLLVLYYLFTLFTLFEIESGQRLKTSRTSFYLALKTLDTPFCVALKTSRTSNFLWSKTLLTSIALWYPLKHIELPLADLVEKQTNFLCLVHRRKISVLILYYSYFL